MPDGMKNTTPRALVLVPKGGDTNRVAELKQTIQAMLPRPVELEDSLSWYLRRFAVCGNIDSYVFDTVTGISYASREPYFEGFFLAEVGEDRCVDEMTHKMVELAISIGKPVYWCPPGANTLQRVRHVQPVEGGGQVVGAES